MLLPTAESLIAADPEKYFETATWNYEFDPVARKDYLDHFSTSEGIHGVRRYICISLFRKCRLMTRLPFFPVLRRL